MSPPSGGFFMPERDIMDLPQTLLGWVNLFAFAWAVTVWCVTRAPRIS